MVFSGLTFMLAFLPIILILYYILPKKGKNIVILISGLLFYSWGEPLYVLVMILSTFIDYTAGRIMDKYDDKPKPEFARNIQVFGFSDKFDKRLVRHGDSKPVCKFV